MKRTNLQIELSQRGLKLIDLARMLNVDKATVSRWSFGRIPAERVVEVEQSTGIGRHILRPDLFAITEQPQTPVAQHDPYQTVNGEAA